MKIKLIPLLFMLLGGKVFAIEFPIEISEYIDDIKIDAYIVKSDITEQSKWTPFKSKPPLSINDALKAVKEYLSTDAKLLDSSLIEIELKQIPHHKAYWHYLIKMESTIDHKLQAHFFVVLMNGKVISAFKEPSSIK